MKNLKKLSRNELKNLKGGEGKPCWCQTDSGTTFGGYTETAEGCWYACTKDLSLQPQ